MYREDGTAVPYNFAQAIKEDFYLVGFYALLLGLPLHYACWEWTTDPKFVQLNESMVMEDPLISSTRLMTVSELCRGISISPNYGKNYYEYGYHLLIKNKYELTTGSDYDDSSISTQASSQKSRKRPAVITSVSALARELQKDDRLFTATSEDVEEAEEEEDDEYNPKEHFVPGGKEIWEKKQKRKTNNRRNSK